MRRRFCTLIHCHTFHKLNLGELASKKWFVLLFNYGQSVICWNLIRWMNEIYSLLRNDVINGIIVKLCNCQAKFMDAMLNDERFRYHPIINPHVANFPIVTLMGLKVQHNE